MTHISLCIITLFRTLFSSEEEYANENDDLKVMGSLPCQGKLKKSLNGPFLFAIDFAFNGFVKFTSTTQTPTTDQDASCHLINQKIAAAAILPILHFVKVSFNTTVIHSSHNFVWHHDTQRYMTVSINVVIKPEFSKFPKKIEVWSLSSS